MILIEVEVVGSNPTTRGPDETSRVWRVKLSRVERHRIYWGVAQMEEHSTDNRKVTGSNPVVPTI